MSFDGDERKWICGKGGGVNLHRVSSIVRDIREPCLHHSPGKVGLICSLMQTDLCDWSSKLFSLCLFGFDDDPII